MSGQHVHHAPSDPSAEKKASAPKSASLQWRPHLQRIVLSPHAAGQAEGRVSWAAAEGSTDDGEWRVLPLGEEAIMPSRHSAFVLERFHEDGLRWYGRRMDFHEDGRLIGPLVMREVAYETPTKWRRRGLAEVLSIVAVVAGAYKLIQSDILPSAEHLAFVFAAAGGMISMFLFDLVMIVRERRWLWASKTERVGCPKELEQIVGSPRPRVLTRVIEDGIEKDNASTA